MKVADSSAPMALEQGNQAYLKGKDLKGGKLFGFKCISSTSLIGLFQIVVFFFIIGLGVFLNKTNDASFNVFYAECIKDYFSLNGEAIQGLQLWRLVTPVFLHANLLHIYGNLSLQFFIGYLLEPLIGWKSFTTLYFLTGIFGNLLSALLISGVTSYGASGSDFGLFAMWLCYLIEYRKKKYFGWCPIVAIFLIVITYIISLGLPIFETGSGVAWTAHVGGFASGLLLYPVISKGAAENPKIKQIGFGVYTVASLVLFLAALFVKIPQPPFYLASTKSMCDNLP